ncbi:DNA-directed RNA polymerase sigma-70 factor [Bacteroidia bacterium]|nr:DNA-directed RNA polymerase sigma-70 factor [Bacteroidia bacterium]
MLNSERSQNDFRERDDKAFSLLFETYLDPLYRYGMKFVSDENIVKDCIQDLFVKIYDNDIILPDVQNLKFYLFLALKNLIINAIKKNSRLSYVSPEDLPFITSYQYSEEEEQDGIDDEVKEQFGKVLSILSPRQKEAIYLKFQMGLSYEEISQLLGINYQSARNLIHRTISKIRENIDFPIFLLLFLKEFGNL